MWEKDIERQQQLVSSVMSEAPVLGEKLEAYSAVQSFPSEGKMYGAALVGAAASNIVKLPSAVGESASVALTRFPIIAVTNKRVILVNTSLINTLHPTSYQTFDFEQIEIIVDRPRIWMPLLRFAKLRMNGTIYRFQYMKWQKRYHFNVVLDRIKVHQTLAPKV